MLGGCPKDAITVCLRQMNDWQLGYALARALEGGTDGPIVKSILTDTVLPLAMAGGHRWLATWAFWTLGRRDLAVRVLIVRRIPPLYLQLTAVTDGSRGCGLGDRQADDSWEH